MKDIKMLAVLMAMVEIGSMSNNRGRQFEPDEVEPPAKVIPKGCKEYSFYGHTVIASNEKTAIKKCKKIVGIC